MSGSPEPKQAVRLNPARMYSEFNRAMERLADKLTTDSVLDYPISAVSRRLRQRLVRDMYPAFARAYAASDSASYRSRLEIDGLRLDFKDRAVRLTRKRIIAEALSFVAVWSTVLLRVLVATVFRADRSRRMTVVTGITAEEVFRGGNDIQFVRFCQNGPVAALSTEALLLVQADGERASVEAQRISYVRRPWLAAAQLHRWQLSETAHFVVEHLRAAKAYLCASWRVPTLALLARDLAYDSLVRSLDRAGALENIVTTCSSYSEQFIWMADLPGRRFGFHTLWYSMSFFPKIYVDDPVESVLPDFLHMSAEQSWVWTNGQAGLLRQWGVPGEMHVIGPLLFYLPGDRTHDVARRSAAVITVFDVTPFSDEALARHGRVGNYYSTETVTTFVEGVRHACHRAAEATGVAIEIRFKPKRSYTTDHDHSYIDRLKHLPESDPHIRLLSPDANLFDVVAESDLVVAIPYSSPAYVAAAQGVPAIYYDSSRRLVPSHESSPHIQFVADADALIVAVARILEHRVRRHAALQSH